MQNIFVVDGHPAGDIGRPWVSNPKKPRTGIIQYTILARLPFENGVPMRAMSKILALIVEHGQYIVRASEDRPDREIVIGANYSDVERKIASIKKHIEGLGEFFDKPVLIKFHADGRNHSFTIGGNNQKGM